MNYDINNNILPTKKCFYKCVGNINLPMHIYYPENFDPQKKHPVMLCIHGGSFYAIKDNEPWEGSCMRHQAIYYRNIGYIGIDISYRSIDLTESTTVFDQIDDVKDACLYIRHNVDGFDKDRLIVMGDSAGGYLAACLGICEDDFIRPQKVIACNPVLDLTKERWHFCLKKTEEMRRNASPLFSKPVKCSQFLLMHGTNDKVVDISDTLSFHNQLIALGFNSTFKSLEGAKHAFILFEYTAAYDDVLKYLEIINQFCYSSPVTTA